MAIALVDSNLAWQRVKIALLNANPAAQGAFAGLKAYLAQQKGNAQLQFIPFTEVQADDADGTGLMDVACRVIAMYVKKENSATDNWVKLYNETTSDATDSAAAIALPLLEANESAFVIYPNGVPFSTGVVVTQHTTQVGSSDGSNGGDGFILIGAA